MITNVRFNLSDHKRTYAHVLPQSEPDLSFTAIPAVEENGNEAGTNGDARPRRRSVSNRKKW